MLHRNPAVDELRRWVERPLTAQLFRQITELLAAAGVAFVLVRGVEGHEPVDEIAEAEADRFQTTAYL